MSRWTLQGRVLHFDGKPFVYIDKEEGTRPVEADGAARLIVDLFNRQGVTPDSIYEKHMGKPRRAREAPRVRARRDDGPISMTYGELPPFEEFMRDIRRPDPEMDWRMYWPNGTIYPMELVDRDEQELAYAFGGLEEFETERQRKGQNSNAHGFKGNEEQIYKFLEYLVGQWNDEGDEAAGNLASSIMTTLGYEWI